MAKLYPLRRHDIGHGPLADAANGIDTPPEPGAFARLIQHLEAGELAACRADACGQDPSRCPAPDACRLANDDDPEGIGVIRGLVWSIGITLGCIAAAALLAWRLQ